MTTNGYALDKLTPRQKEVYDFIVACIAENGYAPTLREIGKALGISSPNGVQIHLNALRKKQAISSKEKKARGIKIVGYKAVLVPEQIKVLDGTDKSMKRWRWTEAEGWRMLET